MDKMINVDELIEFCNTERAMLHAHGNSVTCAALRRVVEFAKEYAVEVELVNGWISVKDKLPKFNQKVLVVYNDTDYRNGISIRRMIIAELAVDGYWMEGCTWHPDTSITHWQHLPEPPKGE